MIRMRRLFFGRKAQSITEYAILVSIIIGALIAMQTYVKNTLSAKIKIAADGIHDGKELLYQPKTSKTTQVVVREDGTRSIRGDDADLTIETTGASTTVQEDTTDIDFKALALE